MNTGPVPSYQTPPVVEVVWGVQFSRLPGITASHLGLFWELIRDGYPHCEEKPPVERKMEQQDLLQQRRIQPEILTKPPLCRQWFASAEGNDIVQLQADRFSINWVKKKDNNTYPRFVYMRDQFARRWNQFKEFTQKELETEPQVELLEMTYVNHVFKDEGWSMPGEIGKVFPAVSFHQERAEFLGPPATLGANMVFDIEGTGGRLHVFCRHARLLQEPSPELFRLEFVARGRHDKGDTESLIEWFSKAREWIVRGFADLTDKTIQEEQWGRQQ